MSVRSGGVARPAPNLLIPWLALARAQNRFANPPAHRYRLARKNRREPRDHNYDLAFIPNRMNAHASY